MCLLRTAYFSPVVGWLSSVCTAQRDRDRDKVWNSKNNNNNKMSTCIAVQWKTLARIRRRILCQSGESSMTEKAGTGYFYFLHFFCKWRRRLRCVRRFHVCHISLQPIAFDDLLTWEPQSRTDGDAKRNKMNCCRMTILIYRSSWTCNGIASVYDGVSHVCRRHRE